MEEQQNEEDNWRACCLVFIGGCCRLFVCEELMSSFTIQCWGCNCSETHPWNGPGPEYDSIIDEMKSRGWQRREFGPGANPWFCSHVCAYKSYSAQQAEQWWADKEFVEYCNRQLIHPRYYGLLAIAAFAGILILAALLSECFHA